MQVLPRILGNAEDSTGPSTFNVMKASVALFRTDVTRHIKNGGLGDTLVTMMNSRNCY